MEPLYSRHHCDHSKCPVEGGGVGTFVIIGTLESVLIIEVSLLNINNIIINFELKFNKKTRFRVTRFGNYSGHLWLKKSSVIGHM